MSMEKIAKINVSGQNYTRSDFDTGEVIKTPTPERTQYTLIDIKTYDMIDHMFFSSEEEARKYAQRKNIKLVTNKYNLDWDYNKSRVEKYLEESLVQKVRNQIREEVKRLKRK